MIWAIASSAFVIYLYRTLNATPGPETVNDTNPDDLTGAELAKLSSRIDSLESIVREKMRRITP